MARAGCSPVGSAYPSAQPAALCAPPELVGLLDQTHDAALGELLRDLISQRGLRVELFRRGLVPVSTEQRWEWIESFELAAPSEHVQEEPTADVPIGTFRLDDERLEALRTLLQDGPAPISGLSSLWPEALPEELEVFVALVVDGGHARPRWGASPKEPRDVALARLNEILRS